MALVCINILLSQEVKPEGGKSIATLVEQMKGPPVTAGEVVTWEARLKIPGGIPPSNLGNVLSYPVVIHVYYFLHVWKYSTNLAKYDDDMKINIKIAIN